jgi:hypothetical protein
MSYFENNEVIDAWLLRRREKFTSSENHKLLKDGAGRNSYIESKVIELTTKVYSRPELDEVESLRHGKMNEWPACERYFNETKNYSMTYMGDENPMFIPCSNMPDESGGTPDIGNIVEGEITKIDYGAEIKCPVNPAYHFRRLQWKTMWDVKEGYPSCYCQIQDLIRLTGAFGWDFISFDERQLSKKTQIKIIEIKPDRKFIDNLELRIQFAVRDKYKMLSDHVGTELKNKTDYINFIKQ